MQLRGLDWKHLKKLDELEKSIRDKIFAYWHFEDDLKEQYFGMTMSYHFYFTYIFWFILM